MCRNWRLAAGLNVQKLKIDLNVQKLKIGRMCRN